MAANYASGAATSPTDLLNLLVTFLTTQGWTIDANAVDGSGKRVHAHKGSDYINLRSAINETIFSGLGGNAGYGIGLYMGTGYSGAAAWNAQAGGPIRQGASDVVGAFMLLPSGAISAYHFFDDGADNIVVVVERSGGLFTHMGWGPSLVKSGTWTGGAYFFGALKGKEGTPSAAVMGDASRGAGCPGAILGLYNVNSTLIDGHALFVRADVDSFTGKWIACSGPVTDSDEGYTGKFGSTGIEYNNASELFPLDFPSYSRLVIAGRGISAFNSQSPMLPVVVYVQRDAGGYSRLGQIPNIRSCSASPDGGVANASLITVGAQTFMVFPLFTVRKFA